MGEHAQRLLVAGARISDGMGQAAHRLDVLRENIQAGVDDRLDVREHPLEVRRQRLDRGVGITALDGPNTGGVVAGAAIRQIIPVDRSQHDVFELHQLDTAGGVLRLVRIQPAMRITGIDGAETAGAGANRAHEHDRGGARIPALTDVRALRLLADGGEAVLLHDAFDGLKARARRRLGPQP